MSYVVLARKYRPRSFSEVLQQDHVTRVLENAIAADRVAHAILFTGPRGTGKTTIARILAKAMNCAEGATPTPCHNCRSCRDIAEGHAVDVFEIDGASNNGVDQIRELRDNVQYMPAHSRYKIYIIDEVHMLSMPAFNALLKTLEEPPPHILFLLATTEPKKIPVTILSRCQRHDLRRIDSAHIRAHLERICKREGIDLAPRSLALIARQARGSMRDALSLLDQVASAEGGAIDHDEVLNILGVFDDAVLPELSAAIIANDLSHMLGIIQDMYAHGYGMLDLLTGLVAHLRNMLLLKTDPKLASMMDLSASEVDHIKAQIDSVSPLYLNQLLDVLLKEEKTIRWSSQPKLALEVSLIKLARITPAVPIDELVERIDQLRRTLTSSKGGELSEGKKAYGTTAASTLEAPIDRQSPAAPPLRAKPDDEGSTEGVSAISASSDATGGLWPRMLSVIAESHPSLAPNLANSKLVDVGDRHMTIALNGSRFSLKRMQRPETIDVINRVARSILKKDLRVVFKQDPQKADDLPKPQAGNRDQRKKDALDHPLVADAIEIFDAALVDVKLS